MSSKAEVLIVTSLDETVATARSALESSERFAVGEVCRNLEELGACLDRKAAQAVLVDIDPEPTRTLAGLGTISNRFTDTRFIVLAKELSNGLMIEAMQVGARHFMVKADLGAELCDVLHRLVPEGLSASQLQGYTVTVLSASGGCGATTVAVNLANELQLLSSDPALLVDMDCNYGSAATFLGLRGQYGLADILDRNGELDPQLIRSTALDYTEKLSLLINPATVNLRSPAALEYARLQSAIQVCKQTYQHTVIDAPRISIEIASDLIHVSEVVLLVLQLTVKDIAMATAMLSALGEHGVDTAVITPVVNRYHKRRSMIELQEVEKALRGLPIQCLSSDYNSAVKGLNYGQPLARSAPRSVLHRELKALAKKVHEVGSKKNLAALSG